MSAPAVNVPRKNTLRAAWLMSMKPPAPTSRRPKRLTLTLPWRSASAMPRKAWSSPAAVVEVELVRLVDDRLRVGGRAEAQAAGGHAADGARLDGQRDQVQDPLLVGHGGDALGYPDAEVHDRVDLQQHRGAARDHLARVQRRRARRLRHDAHLARVRGVVVLVERLHVRGDAAGDDDAVDEDAGDPDLPRRAAGGGW